MTVIVHVCEFTKGGIETHLNEVLQYQKHNYDVFLIASELNTNKENLPLDPTRVILYPYERSLKYFIKAIWFIRKQLKQIKPDIVHIHGTFAGLFVRLLLFLSGRKYRVIYCSHGWSFLMEIHPIKKRIYAMIEKVLSIKTDSIIHISKYEYLKAMEYGLPADKSQVIYNGVSERKVQFEEVSERIKFDPNKISLLFIGRFDRQKGFDILLDVFNRNNFNQVNLYLIGASVLNDAKYNFPYNSIQLGWINNKEIDFYISQADCVIIPSRWEGFGIVAIEAMRNGKAVVCSNRGALPELVRHNENGYVFNLDRLNELKSIIGSLDKATLKKMGERSREIYLAHFIAEEMNQQILNTYLNKPSLNHEVSLNL
ncbi:glycosyltransferase [Paenibacillus sp. FSL W8-1187]|uniref:glycosyltransferase n=1 Tax=Paenibacillus sp. FSL W8-1187 TaxID=2975339 RepID=UPI0030D9F2E6